MENLSGRKELEELAQTGKYVFHGSAAVVEKLEPRQAHDYTSGVKKPDYKPAVFATDRIDTAIFMALYDAAPSPKHGQFSLRNNEISFYVSPNAFDNPNLKGVVYVLNMSDFQHLRGIEFVSEREVTPAKIVEVGVGDLPGDIGTIPLH